MLWKKIRPAPSEMTCEISQNSMPSPIAATSLPNTTRLRCGVVRNVAVAVWYWNSLVMTRMPSSITSTRPKNWPEVKMLPAALTSWAAGRGLRRTLLGLGHPPADAPGRIRSGVRCCGPRQVAGGLGPCCPTATGR